MQERLQGVLNYPEMQMLTKSTQLTQNLLYKEKEHQGESRSKKAEENSGEAIGNSQIRFSILFKINDFFFVVPF